MLGDDALCRAIRQDHVREQKKLGKIEGDSESLSDHQPLFATLSICKANSHIRKR